jgi:hypothetical protein
MLQINRDQLGNYRRPVHRKCGNGLLRAACFRRGFGNHAGHNIRNHHPRSRWVRRRRNQQQRLLNIDAQSSIYNKPVFPSLPLRGCRRVDRASAVSRTPPITHWHSVSGFSHAAQYPTALHALTYSSQIRSCFSRAARNSRSACFSRMRSLVIFGLSWITLPSIQSSNPGSLPGRIE